MVAYEGKEPYVFVSYAHKDKNKVMPLVEGLQKRGFRVWYDEGIEVGFEWTESIASHLSKSKCVLAFVSRNFDASHNCRREINFAIKKRKDPMVIYMEDEELLSDGMQMQLCPLHAMYLDHYADYERFLDVLSRAALLKPCLGAAVRAESPAPAPVKPPEPSAAELARQGRTFYDRKEYEKAIPLFQRAAEQGDARAQFNLGICYHLGKGVTQNYEEAVKWYRKAAEQGDEDAQFNLGVCYERGKGVTQNYEEAVKWYRKAAEQGYSHAQFNLGVCYERGEGVTQNYEEAVKWYRKAAEQGDSDAQFNLGYCYVQGLGVTQNDEAAVKWYRKAAEQGDSHAQFNLGVCYDEGLGVTQNDEEAVKWYRKAAEQGDSDAQFNLGNCYKNGRGVRKNKAEARKWYQKAADQGDEDAIKALENL